MNAPFPAPLAVAAVTVVTAEPPTADALLIAPVGAASALGSTASLTVEGGRVVEALTETETGQAALLIAPEGPVTLRYRFAPSPAAPRWPEAAFAHRRNRYTEPAEALVEASQAIARAAGGGRAGLQALVEETRARFTYAHPESRFNDGHDTVPHLGCGVVAGSCVDINTYLIASLRSAGYRAAYLYGYFFPQDKGDWCVDGHCWVATEHEGETLEWDIAHHIKAGLHPVRPGLNPRGGRRTMISHSMGHRFRAGRGEIAMKVLGEPHWVVGTQVLTKIPQTSIRAA